MYLGMLLADLIPVLGHDGSRCRGCGTRRVDTAEYGLPCQIPCVTLDQRAVIGAEDGRVACSGRGCHQLAGNGPDRLAVVDSRCGVGVCSDIQSRQHDVSGDPARVLS